LLTGQHAHVNGVTGHYSSLPKDATTVAHVLRADGYQTAWFGKWHLYDHPPIPGDPEGTGVAQIVVPEDRRGGFTHWEAFEGGNVLVDPWVHTGEDPVPRRRSGYQPDVLTSAVADFIEAQAAEPWFAVLSTEPPHNPYEAAPAEYRSRYEPEDIVLRPNVPRGAPVEPRARQDLAGYYAHIEATDAAIGRLLQVLEDSGMAQNTVVFFFSDHGDLLGSHGAYMKTRPLEEAIRIPLLIRWPGVIPAGLVTDALIAEVDLSPTLLGLVGIPVPQSMQGKDLSGIALGSDEPGPEYALLQHVDGLGHANGTRLPWRAVRTKDFLFGCTTGQEEWLYDLQDDPHQTRNLVLVGGAKAQRAAAREVLAKALREAGDPFELPESYEPPW